jgi:hypothetical protein
MSRFISEGYKTANEAATRAGVLKGQNYTVLIAGPVDVVAKRQPPGQTDFAWPNEPGTNWYIVIATDGSIGPA